MVVKDYKDIFKSLSPVLVKYNGEIIFNDDDIDLAENYQLLLKKYNDFLNSDKPVTAFNVKVVHFHHTILDIKG